MRYTYKTSGFMSRLKANERVVAVQDGGRGPWGPSFLIEVAVPFHSRISTKKRGRR